MRMKALVSTFAAACFAVIGTAHAVPITYDFTGSGVVNTYTGVGTNRTFVSAFFTGTVTIDVNPAGPSGSDSNTDGSTIAYDDSGWVTSEFVINWGSSSFTPSPRPGETVSLNRGLVRNDGNDGFGYDLLENITQYYGSHSFTYARLYRATTDTTWLSDLSFPETAGLAPGDSHATNFVSFDDYSWMDNPISGLHDYTGFYGSLDLTSFEARSTSVPEPGSLALLSMGLLVAGFVRQRRTGAGISAAC